MGSPSYPKACATTRSPSRSATPALSRATSRRVVQADDQGLQARAARRGASEGVRQREQDAWVSLHPAAGGLIVDYLTADRRGKEATGVLFRAVGNRAGGLTEAITADAIYKIVRGYLAKLGFEIGQMPSGRATSLPRAALLEAARYAAACHIGKHAKGRLHVKRRARTVRLWLPRRGTAAPPSNGAPPAVNAPAFVGRGCRLVASPTQERGSRHGGCCSSPFFRRRHAWSGREPVADHAGRVGARCDVVPVGERMIGRRIGDATEIERAVDRLAPERERAPVPRRAMTTAVADPQHQAGQQPAVPVQRQGPAGAARDRPGSAGTG